VLNCEGKALGFVLANNTSLLSLLRHEIDVQVSVNRYNQFFLFVIEEVYYN